MEPVHIKEESPVLESVHIKEESPVLEQQTGTGKTPYNCHECGADFRHHSTVKHHLRVLKVQLGYPCERQDSEMEPVHIKEELPELDPVHVEEESPVLESVHIKRVILNSKPLSSLQGSLPCPGCGESFNPEGNLETSPGKTLHRCAGSVKTFRESGILNGQQQTGTGKTPYNCHECGADFRPHSTVKHHLRVLKVQLGYPCERQDSEVEPVHIKEELPELDPVHVKEESPVLESVHIKEESPALESVHIKRVILNSKPLSSLQGSLPCPGCGENFNPEGNCETSPGKTLHRCAGSVKTFRESGILNGQQQTGTGKTPYNCHDCGADFRHHSTVKHHLRVLKVQLGYPCERQDSEMEPVHIKEELPELDPVHVKEESPVLESVHIKEESPVLESVHIKEEGPVLESVHIKRVILNSKPLSSLQGSLPCPGCGESFNPERNLETSPVKTLHRCAGCVNTFRESGILNGQQQTGTGKTPYNCHECGADFRHHSTVKHHLRVLKVQLGYPCERQDSEMEPVHIKEELPELEPVHVKEELPELDPVHVKEEGNHFKTSSLQGSLSCTECGKSFNRLGHLKDHQLIHTGEKQQVCADCGKSFSQLKNLKRHQRIHSGEKPHVCDDCGKSFSQSGNLKKHQRIHTGEKPIACADCGKNFRDLQNLKLHQRIHTGEKPYACADCGKSFSQSRTLRNHQLIHTGENPHHCNDCGKSFRWIYSLKRHQRFHTAEKPHHCCPVLLKDTNASCESLVRM
ncbi:zinc finger protein 271-like isoform X1 [Acipenser oxyrinchus oxyrinchus]|uniref:Zinc finger protein 271-like isoform X1 n=1 Tax=Acipenser oxyrinchus oxyrinchus TaxID=40147 RepID=A0AAD8CIF0_ACIOX|nr:zinc finger protein 271-like isoform X1 [Acipenser oxyrinchus oxyrinchus]